LSWSGIIFSPGFGSAARFVARVGDSGGAVMRLVLSDGRLESVLTLPQAPAYFCASADGHSFVTADSADHEKGWLVYMDRTTSMTQSFTLEKPPADEGPLIRSTLHVVLVPTAVTDKKGRTINGLRANDFELSDNDKPQKIDRDIVFLPMSMVICIQRSANVEAVLPKIRRIGTAMHDLLIGEGGEAAVVSFDHRIETVQDFTGDADKINKAVEKIKLGGQNSRMIDAVQEAVHMLRNKKDRRKVILLISETLDRSSEAHVREVAMDLELNNIDVYTLNISRIVTSLTASPELPRPDPFPPGARPHPAGTSMDPTTIAQLDGAPGDSAVRQEMSRLPQPADGKWGCNYQQYPDQYHKYRTNCNLYRNPACRKLCRNGIYGNGDDQSDSYNYCDDYFRMQWSRIYGYTG